MRRTLLACVNRIACIAGLSIALAIMLPGQARAERRYAVVIGANAGWTQDRPLRYAENDAERIRDVLVALGGFAADRVALLRDPDTGEVREALRQLATAARKASEDALVFVYYSGHADARHLHLRGEPPLSQGELQDTLRAMPAAIKLAVIDACKSGAVLRKGGGPAAEFDVDVVAPQLSGLVLLTSSGADELSQESRALAGSVFTHHLVSGMRGAADDDSDQRVTVAEAYRYAYERTRADTATSGALQRPAFRYELSGQGEIVLTELATGRAQLRVPRGPPQKYVILDAHEWRLIAEVRASPDRDLVLALAPGTYHVKRVLEDRLEVASIALGAAGQTDIDRAAYRSMPLSTGILKGEPSELSPDEHHEWSRSRAFALTDGQPVAALNLFDRLLRESPGDMLAWRGRARALVRMAESYRRVNDTQGEERARQEALRSDPSLSYDTEFQARYQQFLTRNAALRAVDTARYEHEMAIRTSPRSIRRWGLGIELASGRGLFGVSGAMVVGQRLFPRVTLDILGLGFDGSVGVAILSSRWTPYIGIGGHVSLRQLGVDLGDHTMTSSMASSDADLNKELGLHGRIEAGAQFVGSSGFTTELGLSVIAYQGDRGLTATALPMIHLGWLF